MAAGAPPGTGSFASAVSRALARIERIPDDDIEETGDPARDVLLRALAAARFVRRDDDEDDAVRALATRLPAPPIPLAKDDYHLFELLPPPEGGPRWVAIYVREGHLEEAGVDDTRWGEWDEKHYPGILLERPEVPAGTHPVLFHHAARALVPVHLAPFLDLEFQLWDVDLASDKDVATLPTTPELYIVAELFTRRSKIGGVPTLNESDNEPPLGSDAEEMRYAFRT